MQIKINIFKIIICLLSYFLLSLNLFADEFNIIAKEISIDEVNNILVGKGSVVVTDQDGRIIKANKIIYQKQEEFLTAEGSVEIIDTDKNILRSKSATYDKINELITTHEDSKVILKEGYTLESNYISYQTEEKIISSNLSSTAYDIEGNIINVDMFQYLIKENLFSSLGNTEIIDKNKNKYFFKQFYIDTKKKEMIGSDVNVLLDKENFGVDDENEPRFASNDIYLTKNKTNLSKGVFTVCKNRGKDKCPPWSLKAKKISHDKTKKTIYYDHAILKFYNIPLFYFPYFFHPDPTVKRQSGFLTPTFTNSTSVGAGFGMPYYWAISQDKDLTITTKTYKDENMLFLNEFRQAFRNGFLTLDTSYTEGYKNPTSVKSKGSRSHIFTSLDLDFAKDENKDYESNFSLQTQRVSNDTYFRIHDINTNLVESSNTNLINKISYEYKKNNTFLNISGSVYEDLRKKSDRFEYITPNILFGKNFFTESFGTLKFTSNVKHKNYQADKYTTFLTNRLVFTPVTSINKSGFVNSLQGIIENKNYEAKKTADYKNNDTINELTSVISYKSSLPMKKQGLNFSKVFSPSFMVRYAPLHMRNLSQEDARLNYSNLYSLNKTSEIEDGLSAILGYDFKINEKDKNGNDREKLSLSMGQVFNRKENDDMPSNSSLDQKTSDVVGDINYNFSEIGNISYKFNLDHNFNTINYNEISSNLNLGKIDLNLNYLEQRKHIGTEHYLVSGVAFNINDNNKLAYGSKKNYKTNSTELYDISYQYKIDCLTAGLVFRRQFYQDTDVNNQESLMFKISFIPFGGEVKSPRIK